MSIVKLKKITLYGCLREKLQILDDMQSLGCLHIMPLTIQDNLLDKNLDSSSQSREALKYLSTCPRKLKQIKDSISFDPASIEQQILQNKHKTEDLQDERDSIKQKIKELEPWGNFVLPDPNEIGNQKFWFYIVPIKEIKKFIFDKICAQQVSKDNLFYYVAVVSENEPELMPGTQVKLSNEPLNTLKKRFDQIDFDLEDLQIERTNLTRWLELFESNIFKLEDNAALTKASNQTHDANPVFAIQGWIPSSDVKSVETDRKSVV